MLHEDYIDRLAEEINTDWLGDGKNTLTYRMGRLEFMVELHYHSYITYHGSLYFPPEYSYRIRINRIGTWIGQHFVWLDDRDAERLQERLEAYYGFESF